MSLRDDYSEPEIVKRQFDDFPPDYVVEIRGFPIRYFRDEREAEAFIDGYKYAHDVI